MLLHIVFGQSHSGDSEFAYHRKQRNKYDEALYIIQLSHWKHTTPRKYRWKGHPLCTDIDYRERENKNRSKRKRDYRVECRKNYLRMHSQRENFILKLTHCGAFQREDVDYLHQVDEGQYFPYDSRTRDDTMTRLSVCVRRLSIL